MNTIRTPVPIRTAIACLGLVLTAAAALAQGGGAQISIAPIILVEPTVETPLPIEVGPPAALPKNAFLRIRGLPPQTTFSDGHFVSAGTWALPLASLADLKVTVPLAATGRAELQLALLAIDGAVMAEARTTLAITGGSVGNLAAPQPPLPAARLPGRASLGNEPVLQQPPTPAAKAIPPAIARVEPPAPPPMPAMKPEERERALKLLTRGDAELNGGDVAGARLLYQRAADAGLPEAAMAMGMTYDPGELARRGVKGLQGDPETARKWYAKAQDLGAPGAAERLGRLPR